LAKGVFYLTQLEAARRGVVTDEMQEVARKEGLTGEFVRSSVAAGTIVIPCNAGRRGKVAAGTGAGLATKVSASIGTPKDGDDYREELAKLAVALAAGADAVMDLSTGGDLDYMRREVLQRTSLPVGTMPVYQVFMEASERDGILNVDPEEIFQVIEKQARDGVDFMGLHCGMTRRTLEVAKGQGRAADLVSWGGSLLAGWMLHREEENPLYEQYDRLLEIAGRYDVTLSLADGLRPGCVSDSLDRAQVQELVILGELVDRARAAGVQVMVKGPGHAPLPHLAATVQLMKQMCKGAPYFVFGPIVTDVAPGYDHITAAIGAAFCAAAGADFICYVTPAEHVGFPGAGDVHEGVMAARLAAHAGDLAKGAAGAWERDLAVARARNPWNRQAQRKFVIDPDKLAGPRDGVDMEGGTECRKCKSGCAAEVVSRFFGREEISYC